MKRFLFTLTAFLVLGTARLPAAEAPLTVFVFAGQSNMLGNRSKAKDLPAEYQGEQPDVFIFTGANWEPYRPGLGQPAGFGPEVTAALDLSKALGKPIGIVKHSIGGTNLALEWNPAIPGNLYTTLKNKVAAAAKARPIKVAGAFWAQGGADARFEKMAAAYATNLDALIATMRKDFKNPSLSFVAGLTGFKNAKPHPRYPGLTTVRAAQVQERENYTSVDCSDITTVLDRVHYDTHGIATLGRRIATEMQTLLVRNTK